jgi:hypothetical protein
LRRASGRKLAPPAGVYLLLHCASAALVGKNAFEDWAELSEGAYLLRSNITDWSDRQLWTA